MTIEAYRQLCAFPHRLVTSVVAELGLTLDLALFRSFHVQQSLLKHLPFLCFCIKLKQESFETSGHKSKEPGYIMLSGKYKT